MTRDEYLRLKEYWQLKKLSREHRPTTSGKRYEKGRGLGVGFVGSKSFIKPQVSMEKLFI